MIAVAIAQAYVAARARALSVDVLGVRMSEWEPRSLNFERLPQPQLTDWLALRHILPLAKIVLERCEVLKGGSGTPVIF
jgi:hypothetical protein